MYKTYITQVFLSKYVYTNICVYVKEDVQNKQGSCGSQVYMHISKHIGYRIVVN